MCAALGPVIAPESGLLGGNHRTLGPPALLYPPPLLTHCSGPARSTSKTSISRTRVGRGLQAVRWCWPQTQPRQPHPLGVLGPRPSSASPAPETAGSLSPSSLWLKPAPPHLTQARRAPDRELLHAPFFPGRTAGAGSGRDLQWWQGSSCCSSFFPTPFEPTPRVLSCRLFSGSPLSSPSDGGLALGVPHQLCFLLGHSGPER